MPGAGQYYSIQLLLPHRVHLDAFALVTMLRRWRSDVELTACDRDHVTVEIQTADLPLFVQLFHAQPEAFAVPLTDALLWSPTWNERWDDTARRCPHSIIVSMTSQRPLNYASMLQAFLAVLDTLLAYLDDDEREQVVLHWIPAKQLLTFEQYRILRTEHGPSGPAVNVRMANATGRPGELLADTVGLAQLGLPDLQLIFSDRDPSDVAERLRAYVRRLFVGERIDCEWFEEASYVPPYRDALTLDLDLD
ncbi:MAG: DUF4261 domain-containing protein [Kofleriaceae bacterium]|nr:DUF4261 domain-containing protein [Kofleriaceae bacterium]